MPSPISQWLVENNIRIKDNPAVSPDVTLEYASLLESIRKDSAELEDLIANKRFQGLNTTLKHVILWHGSEFEADGCSFYVVEYAATGDHGLICVGESDVAFTDTELVGKLKVIPLYWENFIALKNLVQKNDAQSTIFPSASEPLDTTSLGIGARFTTLHWPGVAWAMKQLKLSLTANQNSIPRELVYSVDAMMQDKQTQVPFPFIGRSVPEGHQGQSVMGMSVMAVVTYLKYGFHKSRIPWGFNADHQPIGGRFDEIEQQLVEGSLFASYITYDLSPELSQTEMPPAKSDTEKAQPLTVDTGLYNKVLERLFDSGVTIDESEVRRLVAYLSPAMKKMKQRDTLYKEIREKHFTTGIGKAFFKELSIDEIPGKTTPEMMAVALAMSDAIGVRFQYIAPNIGFQKNFPYEDNVELGRNVTKLYDIAARFGASIGFHSGSGKSASNYQVCGDICQGNLEIKTAGRYTYEMGRALSESSNSYDSALWKDWYEFCKKLAVQGAFADNEVQKKHAREFITHALKRDSLPIDGVFESPESLQSALNMLSPSPDHMFWFEYNFLFVLAGEGSTEKMGDHSPVGYEQRKRFYSISEEGRLRFAKNIAGYIVFMAESTGLVEKSVADSAKSRLSGYSDFSALVGDIS